jgi:predicted DsbA family dithiol-disulfide isomerase
MTVMYDLLFEHRKALEDRDLVAYATELGLDINRFKRELAAHTYASRIDADVASGEESGVQGTPNLFLNGRLHRGTYDLDSLLTAISRLDRASSG